MSNKISIGKNTEDFYHYMMGLDTLANKDKCSFDGEYISFDGNEQEIGFLLQEYYQKKSEVKKESSGSGPMIKRGKVDQDLKIVKIDN